jgi:hypothetical protein
VGDLLPQLLVADQLAPRRAPVGLSTAARLHGDDREQLVAEPVALEGGARRCSAPARCPHRDHRRYSAAAAAAAQRSAPCAEDGGARRVRAPPRRRRAAAVPESRARRARRPPVLDGGIPSGTSSGMSKRSASSARPWRRGLRPAPSHRQRPRGEQGHGQLGCGRQG